MERRDVVQPQVREAGHFRIDLVDFSAEGQVMHVGHREPLRAACGLDAKDKFVGGKVALYIQRNVTQNDIAEIGMPAVFDDGSGSTAGIAKETTFTLMPFALTTTLLKMASLLSSTIVPSGLMVRPSTPPMDVR
jgi:hypothetical protein